MKTFENTMKVNRMKFTAFTVPYCRLGKNYYHANVECEIEFQETIVDLLDIEAYFKGLNGADLIDEELVAEVFKTLQDVYKPARLRVTVRTASHFPLEITKEM